MKAIKRSAQHHSTVVLALLVWSTLSAVGQMQFTGPKPGDVYREYSRVMSPAAGNEWRVTDPDISLTIYPQAAEFLPNPTLTIPIGDLTGATRAEAVIILWGGHVSTYGRKLRFNGNAWIDIPDPDTSNGIPVGHLGVNYLHQVMVTIPIPLAYLTQGTNTFEGTNEGQLGEPEGHGFHWGQFGWYGMMVRVYYDASKTYTTGRISSPEGGRTFTDNPTILTTVDGSVDRVDVLAFYDGYDTDGDGVYKEYHHDYNYVLTNPAMEIRNHVGTVTSAPFSVVWNTKWVPDQEAGSIKLVARIRGTNGIWYVTPEVTGLSLVRSGKSVRLYKPFDTPEEAWARGDNEPIRINVAVPSGTNLSSASDAIYYSRTWNGLDAVREPGESHYRRLNGWDDPSEYGGDHYFSFDIRSVPTAVLRTGNNEFSFYSETVAHHGMEILWPGPALAAEYTGTYASPIPAAATLATPAHNASGQAVVLTLRWHPAPAATSYDIQVAVDSSFGSIIVSQTNVADTSLQVGPLSDLTRYFWRVRGRNSAGTGAFSPVWAFNTLVASPALTSPPNNATQQATTVPVLWRSLPGATSYRLQISLTADFPSGSIVKDTTLADTACTLRGLQYTTSYYWRVAAQIAGLWGEYSTPWVFTTAIAAAGVPTLLHPPDNATDQPVGLAIRWRAVAGAAQYHLQIGTDSTFSSGILASDSTLTDTVRTVTGLGFNRLYYWRVAAKNAGGSAGFSTLWHFRTVMSVPTAPVLITPPFGAVEQQTIGLAFSWRKLPGASHYTLQVATDSTFSSGLIKNDTTITDTMRSISGLSQSTRYFWRVAGRNAGGSGPFSTPWHFTTLMPVPGEVTLVSPANLAVVAADSVRCTWTSPDPPAARYWFEISVDSTFGGFAMVDSSLTDTARVVRPLVNNTTYYWRVRGGTIGTWGPFSATHRFLSLVTSVFSAESVPDGLVLRQNYPNPFNPATEIEFGVPKESHVRIDVYNVLGQRVATMLDANRAAGYHNVRFDAGNLTSGVYLYRLTTGETSLLRKMILAK